MGRIKKWWKRYKANWPYTRRELKNIHRLAMSDAYMDGNGMECIEVQSDVLDKILRGYIALKLDVVFWCGLTALLALLVLLMQWRG